MSLQIVPTKAFRQDFKRLSKSPRHDVGELRGILEMLAKGESLPSRLRDHSLGGDWKGCRECHVRPDWLLVYKLEPERLILVRTGSHSDLFG